jgi:hypothetical protein
VRCGHWYRDLSPDERARLNELDRKARAEPLRFELPEERRRRLDPIVHRLPGEKPTRKLNPPIGLDEFRAAMAASAAGTPR